MPRGSRSPAGIVSGCPSRGIDQAKKVILSPAIANSVILPNMPAPQAVLNLVDFFWPSMRKFTWQGHRVTLPSALRRLDHGPAHGDRLDNCPHSSCPLARSHQPAEAIPLPAGSRPPPSRRGRPAASTAAGPERPWALPISVMASRCRELGDGRWPACQARPGRSRSQRPSRLRRRSGRSPGPASTKASTVRPEMKPSRARPGSCS